MTRFAPLVTWSARGRPNLRQFGISIPLLAERSQQILQNLHELHLHRRIPHLELRELDANPVAWDLIDEVHGQEYADRLKDPTTAELEVIHAYELKNPDGSWNRFHPSNAQRPLHELVTEQRIEAELTRLTAWLALKHRFAYFLGGGMHHASRHEGRGFCIIHDVVMALRDLQKSGVIKNAIVIDVDAHKGDGTAELTADDSSIRTLSIHMAESWPLTEPLCYSDGRPHPAHAPSDIDIGVSAGEELSYVERLAAGIDQLFALVNQSIDLAVVVNGSDPSKLDTLKSTEPMQLTLEQLLDRDKLVYNKLRTAAIPQLWVMAGGYGPEVYRVHLQFLAWLGSIEP